MSKKICSYIFVLGIEKKATRKTGVVKSFNAAKGFGYITPDDGSPDIMVLFSGIEGSGFKSLSEGQNVIYDVMNAPNGIFADNVDVIP